METIFNNRRHASRRSTAGSVYQSTPFGTPPMPRQATNADPMRGYVPVNGISSSHNSSTCSGSSSWVLWRDEPNSLYRDPRARRGRICSALLAVAVFLVVLTVLAIAGLAVYMGALRIDTNKPELIFEGNVRVTSGDEFVPALSNNNSAVFKEMALKYQNMIDKVYQRSQLRPAYKKCEVEKFENGSLVVFFRLYLDRRKIPRSFLNVEETARDILVNELIAPRTAAFKNVQIDATSIFIKRCMDDIAEPNSKKKLSDNRTLEMKNGVLRKATSDLTTEHIFVKNSSELISSSEISSSNSNETSKEVVSGVEQPVGEAVPVIAGSVVITKLLDSGSGTLAEKPNFSKVKSSTPFPLQDSEPINNTKPPNNSSTVDKNSSVLFSMKPSSDLETTSTSTSTSTTVKNGMSSTAETFEDTDFYPIANPEKTVNQTSNQTMEDRISYEGEISVSGEITKEISGINQENHVLDQEISSEIATEVNSTNDPLIKRIGDKEVPLIGSNHTPNPLHFKTNSYNERYQTAWNIKSSTPSYEFKPAFLQTDEPWRPILPYSKQSPKPAPHYEYEDVIGTGVAGVAEVIPIPPSAVENINVEQIDKLDNRYSSRIGQAADESNHRHQEDVPGVYGSLNVNTDLQDSQNNDTVSRVSLRVVGSGGLNNDETSVIHTTSGGGIIVRKPQPQPQPQPVTFHPPHTIPLTYTTTEPPSTRRSIANPFTVPELPILHQFRDVDAILKPPAIPGSKYHQDSNLDIKDTAIRPHYRDSAIGTGPVDVLPSQVHQADTFWSEQKNEKIGIRPHYNKPPSNVPFGMGYVLPAEEHPIQNSWNNRRNKNNTEPVYKEAAIEIKSNSPITGTNIGFTSSENHQNQPFWVDMRKRNTSNENLKDDPTKTPSANPSLGFGSVSPIIEEPQWIELVNVTTSAVKPQKVKTQGTSLYSEPSINRYHRPVWGDVGYRGRPSYRDPSFTSVDSSSSKVHVNKTTRVEFNKVPTTTTPFPLITLMPVRSNSGVRPLRPRPKIPFHRNLTQTDLSFGHTSGILNSGESLFGTGIVGSGKNDGSSHVHNQTEGNQNRTTFTSNRHQAVINSDSYSTTNMPPLINSSKPSTNLSQPHGPTYHIGTVKVESIEDYSNTYTTNNRTQYYTTTRPQTSSNIYSYSPLMSSTTLKPFTTTITTFTTSRSKPKISTSTSIPTSTANTMPSLIKVILSSPPSVLSSLSSSLPTISTSLPSSSSVGLSTEKIILPVKLTTPSTVKTTSLVTQSPTHTTTVKMKVTTKQTPVTTKANVQTTNHTVPTTELVTNATTSQRVKVTNVQTKSSTPATIVKITKMPTAPTTPPTVRVTTKISSLTSEKSTQLPTSSTTVKSVTSTSRVSAPLLSLNASKTVTQSHKVEVFTKPPPSTTTYKVTTDSSFKKKVSNLSSLPEIKASSSNKTVFVTKDSASVEVMTSLAYVDLNKNSHKQQQDINKMASVQINNVTKIIENLMKNSPNMNLSNGTHNIKTKSNGTILHQNTTKIPESAAITEFVSKLPQVKPPSLTTTVPSITFTTTKLAPTSTVRSTSVKITTVKPQYTSASLIRQSTKPITTTVSSRKVSPGTEFNEYIPVAIIRDTSRDPVRYKNNAVHNLDNQQKLKPDKDKQNSTTESFREYKKENKISVEEVSTLAALSNKTVAQNGLQSNTTDKNTSRENTTHHAKSKQENIRQTKPEQGKQNNSAELYTDFKKEYKMDGLSPSEAPSTQNSTENITPSTQNSTKSIAQNIGKNTSVNNVTFKLTPSDLNNKKDFTKHEEYITTPESVTLTPGIVILSTDVVTTTSIILSYGENEEISESEPKTRDTSGTTTPKTEGLTEETTHKSNERIENPLKTNENNHTESISVINSTNPVTVSTVVSSTSVSSTTKTKESRRQPKMKPHLPEVENYMSSKPIFSHASSGSDEIIVRQSLSTQVSDDSMPEASENDKNETKHVVVTISKYEPINYNYSVTFDVPSTLLHKLNDTFTKDTDSSDKFTENISMEVMKTTMLPYEETASENMLTTITEQETKASTLPTFLETLSDEEVYSTKLNNLLTTLVDQGITSEDATTEKTLTTKSESNFPISEDYFNTESEEITNIISETVGTYTNFSVTKVSAPGKVESTQLSDDEVLRLLTFENSTNNHIRNQSIMTQEAMDELSKYANIHKNQPPSTADATDVETTTATYIGDNITKPEYHEEKLSTKAVSSLSNTNHAAIPILTKIYNKVPQHSEEKPSWKATTSDGISSELANETACPSNMSLRCGDGECISALSRCNQLVDCSDGADERDCTCADYLKAQFLTRKLCDGIVDCWDFSDENNCEWCTPGQFVCPNSQVCVDQHRLCDGSRDCPYGDDEKQCVTVAQNEVQAGDFPYSSEGYLMVRKQGRWGKLCLQNFNKVVERSQSSWEVSDLGRAVCKAMTYSDFDRVNRTIDSPTDSRADDSHYFELAYSSDTNGNTSQPRSSLSFQETECTQKEVVHVSCRDLECGVRPQAVNQWARIVGGGNAAPGAWPWQAALYKEGEFQCGATLIADRWLVSAGHCFYHALDDYWVARLGALRRGSSFPSPYEQLRPVSHIILHPGYVDAGFLNDISLLRLREPVQFSDFVRPVCLPPPPPAASIRDGRLCTVVGWGQLFEVGRIFPDTLQEVQLPIISTAECRKRTLFLPLYRVTDNMFCAGFDRGGRDACLGDSGGPLMCQEKDGRWSLYGVTSNGYGCARANRPGVYTKVANYVPWLQAAMAQQVSSLRDSKTQCKGHRCPLGECLPPTRICNGFMECSDGSDEKNCW